ncbi:hypothetical protein [Roseospira goensis]|uniref:Lipoprotein n=1 Tax=Roseospira goensis TaxID=391922 RepID=A0A7W6S1J8_9PROT|nr:hypothetical protein [Roseospira goensis]MBB4287226.1 hypothetical protein [Roseospira goensis]
MSARPLPALLATLLAGGLLAACAADDGAGWTKPGVTPDQRARDSRACKQTADDYALRRVHQPDRAVPGRATGPGGNVGLDPLAQVDQTEARAAHRRFYTDCMQAKGYLRGGS